jgi:hypothetical protein
LDKRQKFSADHQSTEEEEGIHIVIANRDALRTVRGHGSNVVEWAFCFKCGRGPMPPFVLQMDSTSTQLIADMFLFPIRLNSL